MTTSPDDFPTAELERAVRRFHTAGTATDERDALLGLVVQLEQVSAHLLTIFEHTSRRPQVANTSWAHYGELVQQAVSILFGETPWRDAEPFDA